MGRMKLPHKGLYSTTPKPFPHNLSNDPQTIHNFVAAGENKDTNDIIRPAFISDVDDESIAKVFCFGAFANKNTGVVYNDCTGTFPSMSLDGNVCFL